MYVENSTKLPCLEVTGYRTKYSTAQWLLQHQIRHVRKVVTHRHILSIVIAELQTANIAYFQRKIELSGCCA